jgi:hypothetical protein
MFKGIKEIVWIKKFITKLCMVPSIVYSVTMYYDNNGAVAQAKKPMSYQLSKNILRQFYLIKES